MKRIGLRSKLQDLKLEKPDGSKRIAAFDLGNKLGFAICDFADDNVKRTSDFSELCGMLKLKDSERESWASRFIRFEGFLAKVRPDIVYYEDVKQRFKSNAAATNYGGLVCTLTTWCEKNGIPCVGLDVGSIKKYATGKGNSGKPEMMKAANEKFGMEFDLDNEERDGDVADALHMLALGMNQAYSIDIRANLQPLVKERTSDGKRKGRTKRGSAGTAL